jgi:hypothetical protein
MAMKIWPKTFITKNGILWPRNLAKNIHYQKWHFMAKKFGQKYSYQKWHFL